jgi:predicted TIM-barrel fold metal-dependent hydrolase
VGKYEEVEFLTQVTVDHLIQGIDAGGVEKAVMQAEWSMGDYRKHNDAVYEIITSHPDRFPAGYLCVNPLEDDDMAAVVEREVKERGFKGVNIQPWAYRVHCNDKRFYPVYQKCLDLDIPVTIHCSINFTVNRSIDYGRPVYLDEVACDFPDLTIVANHGGWPWVNELIAVAWKHPNVYKIHRHTGNRLGSPHGIWQFLAAGQGVVCHR